MGAVTWKSIAYAQLRGPQVPFSAAIVPARIHPYSRDLHYVLPDLQSEAFVVVTDSHDKISGVVTTSDVVGLYGERTLPFLLIGELDQELRQLMTSIDLTTIRKLCSASGGVKLKSHDDMTMFHYVTVLGDPACWAGLGWPLDRDAFVAQLNALRRVRNDVMHFNPDGPPAGTVEKLNHMLALIREFGPT